MATRKETVCCFKEIVGGYCGFQTKDRSKSVEVIPLLQCKRSVGAHKSALALSGVENEVDLILSRASMFAPPRNIDKLSICPRHRELLGLGWRRQSSKCSVPTVISKHSSIPKERPKAERGISKWMSQYILQETGILVPVGSGMCCKCRIDLTATRKVTTPPETAISCQMDALTVENEGSVTLLDPVGAVTGAESTQTPTNISEEEKAFETPGGSLFSPPLEATFDITCTPIPRARARFTVREGLSPFEKMNQFLESKDVSPVRYAVSVPWSEASSRSRRRHVRKARQAVGAVLEEIAPHQSAHLWKALVSFKSLETQDSSSDTEDGDVDQALLEALAECYTNASTWQVRRQILSIVADKLQYRTVKRWIPDLTRYRFTTAREHAIRYGRGVPPAPQVHTKMFVSQTQVDHFLDFITSPHIIQDLPFGKKSITLSTKEVISVPIVVRMLIPESIVRQYLAYSKECYFTPLSRRALLNILSVCSASVRKSLQGLDYISSEGAEAFDNLCEVVQQLGDSFMGMPWAKEQSEHLKSAKRYLKSDYKVHVAKTSTVPDHCRQYALSDPGDSDYQLNCNHEHQDACHHCEELTTVLHNIEEGIQTMSANNVSEDTREELLFVFDQSKQNILAWKAHLLRSINQDEARLDVLENLDEKSVLLIEDWAMKFLPRKYRESQTDWFGKRGISWHLTVATRRMTRDQDFEMMTFCHVFQSCNQDSPAVQAIMTDVIGKLKKIMPTLRTVYYRQDNAGCYRSGGTIIGAIQAGDSHGVTVRRLDFSDPQGGKGACDRKAATIKAHVRVHLNEGHDVETASQLVDAIRSSGGVLGLNVSLCDSLVLPSSAAQVKLDGVSTVANVEYANTYIRIWKAYGIGPGKKIPLSKVNIPANFQIARLSTGFEDKEVCDQFSAVKSKTSTTSLASQNARDDPPSTRLSSESSELFVCPEEGCTKSYQRFSALQRHLDCGKHIRELECETMLDKAVRGYAARLECQFTSVPQFREDTTSTVLARQSQLQKGWALKLAQTSRARFSDKQREYLTNKFLIGETTGQKANSLQVAKSMISARDEMGNRKFTSAEFLTAKQITGFFSRLAAKRSISVQSHAPVIFDEKEEVEDGEALTAETAFGELRDHVMASVQPSHPICYNSYNLCLLNSKSKLSSFAIAMLKRICAHFFIDIDDITSKRKAPYISRLENFLKQCTCCQKKPL